MLLFLATVFSSPAAAGQTVRQTDPDIAIGRHSVIAIFIIIIIGVVGGIVDGLPHPAITTVYALSAATWNGLDRRRPSAL